jgi:hypothetical protein
LKCGDYRIQVDGEKALTFKQKGALTSKTLTGNATISEIHIGGLSLEKNPLRVKLADESNYDARFNNDLYRICTAMDPDLAMARLCDYRFRSCDALFRGIYAVPARTQRGARYASCERLSLPLNCH